MRRRMRVDWWTVIVQLHRKGVGLAAISDATEIPISTIAGYKNLNVEPKYADGEAVIALWRERCIGELPMLVGSVRNGLRNCAP